jgi:histidine ammonia-lyase
MPQVHGAVRDVFAHVAGVLEIETGSATDNPLVFPDPSSKTLNNGVVSGGNFHGAPLAYAFDYAAIALTDLTSITERRIDRLLNPDINEGLPAFLSPDPGLSSGFMIAQIVAAALINECQVLSHPSSTGSIPTDGGKEDHVSMGMTGALKLRQIVEHAERIVVDVRGAGVGVPQAATAWPGNRARSREGAGGGSTPGSGQGPGAGHRCTGCGREGRGL